MMLQNLNATKKGFLTGMLMVGLSLIFFYSNLPFESPVQYVIYIVYAGGIVWSILEFAKTANPSAKFGDYFLQGFKCFIVVTLLMVLFTFIFNKMHPEFKEEVAKAFREDMIKKGDKTPAEMDNNVEKMKDFYIAVLLAGAIFSYLIIGAVVTAAVSLVVKRRKS